MQQTNLSSTVIGNPQKRKILDRAIATIAVEKNPINCFDKMTIVGLSTKTNQIVKHTGSRKILERLIQKVNDETIALLNGDEVIVQWNSTVEGDDGTSFYQHSKG